MHRGADILFGQFLTWLRSATGTAVVAVGIVQIIAWGTSFYSLGVLGQAIVTDTGWSGGHVFAGLTVGLLASSVISAWVGRLMDRVGARWPMAFGCVGLAGGLGALAFVDNPWVYLGVWAVIGFAMRFTLYDAAFAAMVEVSPTRGRQAIAYLTLFGGFASTVFWLIGHELLVAIGWRQTYFVFALLNLLICAPLCLLGLRRRGANDDGAVVSHANERAVPEASMTPLEGRARVVAMVLFCVVMSGNALVFGVGAVHLVGIIEASGVSVATAVVIASLKGVAQVAGRVWEILYGYRIAAVGLGRLAIGLLPIAFIVLLVARGDWVTAVVFTLIFGTSNGLVTVVRGAVPLALFGPKGYASVLGLLATPILLSNALSPMIFALIVDAWGYQTGTWVLLAVAFASMLAMELMAIWYRRLKRE